MSDLRVTRLKGRTAGSSPSLPDGVVVSGIGTFSDTTESTSVTTGAVVISGGVGIAKSLHVGGNVSVAGTLTYEDVTNVDSVGLITAKSGIKVGNPSSPGIGVTIDPSGNAVFAGILTATTFSGIEADKIFEGNTEVETIDPSASTYSINVTASGSSNYTLSGNDRNGAVSGSDPTVTVNIGDTLNFVVNASGHPLYIRVADGGANVSTPAATNQGSDSGTVSWMPNAVGTYYYQCGNHAGMIGTITVTAGYIKMTTEGGERVRVGPAGQIGIGGANYGTAGQVITSAGSASAPSWAAIPPGGNVFTGIASGSLANNKAIMLCNDGKLVEVKEETTTNATPASVSSQAYVTSNTVYPYANRIAYDPDNNIYLVVFKRNDNEDLQYMIGNLSGGVNIAWSSQGNVAGSSNITDVDMCYAGNSRFFVVYKDGSNGLSRVRIGKVNSTTSISWSGVLSLDGQSNATYTCPVALNIAADRVAICCRADNTNARWTNTRWGIIVGDITGDTSWTYRNSSGISEDPMQNADYTAAFDSTNNIIFTVWKRNNYHAYCSSIQVASGNAAAITTDGVAGDVVFEASNDFGGPSTIYHPGHNKFVTSWERGGYDDIRSKITTINSSTLAITNGSNIDLSGTNTNLSTDDSIQLTLGPGNAIYCYWIEQNKWLYAVTDSTFNGSTINWSNKVNVAYIYNDYVESINGFWNPNDPSKRNILFGETFGNKPTYMMFATQTTNSNLAQNGDAQAIMGFADQAYTDGQTATIKTYGNNVDTLTGLATGSNYFVQADGTVASTADATLSGALGANCPIAGKAIGFNKLLIRDPWILK